jgi:uncharacterized membrane protein
MTAISPTAGPTTQASAPAARLASLDVMRGLVMVLMAIDHSSGAFNAGRLFTDSASFWTPGSPLPAAQFMTRWITHLCAPTFLFLAGVGLAFTVQKERARGKTELDIDLHLFTRGVIIAAFEIWISVAVVPPGKWLLQVLYAIGASFILMVPLRRLSWRPAAALGFFLILGGEAITGLLAGSDPANAPLPQALLFVGGQKPHLIIAYPAIHWLAMMLLGWALGLYLLANPDSRHRLGRRLAVWGLCSLLVFAVVRGANSYGNMLLYREAPSIIQWLHVSKYPPSVAYTTLELGIMSLCISALFALVRERPPRPNALLLVLGQTPMFFYLLHFPLLEYSARLLGVEHKLGLWSAYAGAAVVIAVLYPVCLWYRRYKAAHRDGWPRYI